MRTNGGKQQKKNERCGDDNHRPSVQPDVSKCQINNNASIPTLVPSNNNPATIMSSFFMNTGQRVVATGLPAA
jgi:hypothetical protein